MKKQINIFEIYGGVPTIKLILKNFSLMLIWKVNSSSSWIYFLRNGYPLTNYLEDFLRKVYTGLNITDIQYYKIVNNLEKFLINFQVENKDITSIKDAIERKRH